jgi:hypothetical protein
MKIKFLGYWNNDYNIYNFINDIWNYDGKYNEYITYGDDYTHIVIINKINYNLNFDKEKTFGIILEPHWSTNFDNNLFDKCKFVLTYETDFYKKNNAIFYPLLGTHRLYNCQYKGEIIYQPETTKTIINSNFQKDKKLSIIVNYHSEANSVKSNYTITRYVERENLVKKLLESDLDFDMYGQDWDTIGVKDRRYKGFLSNKLDGIKNYEYTIALENSSIRGNITEKIIDPILCKTIPIYNGHPSIQEFYPNSCEYLHYDGNEIENIRKIINSEKKEYNFIESIDLYLNHYNPIKIIKEIIENDSI